tara:strand:+ start:656 stop:1210 length:555 start_codon:yes stop_codon:yes gene_type:complete
MFKGKTSNLLEPLSWGGDLTMNFNYYGVEVLLRASTRSELGSDGACWMDPGDTNALIKIAQNLSEQQARMTLVHELGHVWQGIRLDDLQTEIPWPSNHYGASLPCEDFSEALRVATFGLCTQRDEEVLFRWKRGVYGMFEEMISQEEAEDFVSFCKAEVVRVLGFMPDLQLLKHLLNLEYDNEQ